MPGGSHHNIQNEALCVGSYELIIFLGVKIGYQPGPRATELTNIKASGELRDDQVT